MRTVLVAAAVGALLAIPAAADAGGWLSMSVDSFERKVQPFVRLVLDGQLVLVPVSELERWIAERLQGPACPD